MGKLKGKAKKFAKKNLQSVMKKQRKLKSLFKKRASKKVGHGEVEEQETEAIVMPSSRRNAEVEDIKDFSLENVFGGDESDVDECDSDSNGYISEDGSLPDIDGEEAGSHQEGKVNDKNLSEHNQETHLELAKKRKKLDRLIAKDQGFSKFLESNRKRIKASRDDENEYSDEDDGSDDAIKFANGNTARLEEGKLLSSTAIDMYYKLAIEQHNLPSLIRLLNGYRAACHYGAESSSVFEKSGAYSKILILMLRETNNVFCNFLEISASNDRKGIISGLKNNPQWKTFKPLVKSYLRSTLNLLNEVSDSDMLAFALKQLRTCIIFFSEFPPLLQRLVKTSVHLWATSERNLSEQSFLILSDVAAAFNSEWFDACLVKVYKGFISHCKFVEPVLYTHIQFLKNSLVQLFSQDVLSSSSRVMTSVKQLAKILQFGLRTKKKEAVKLICSWQFVNCLDLWVTFISVNISDFEDLRPLLYTVIQVINGVANLFPGPRYLPLRVKCVQWLNHLSSSSRVFIPIASYALDILEYKVGKESQKPGNDLNVSSTTKLPKYSLKSQKFQEECVFSTIELLATHFAQWSYHISFPELATIPLIRLRKFHETNTIERFQRVVKHFIDQVEQNCEVVRKKRDEVSFSPVDQQLVDTFLQLEKSSRNSPFTQYYRSIMENAMSRTLFVNENRNKSLEQKKPKGKRQKLQNNIAAANGES